MNAMKPEIRSRMLTETREAAAAFIEDLAHLREVLKRVDPVRGELRRMSNVLRRFLIDYDGDIRRIAPPRTGRIMIKSPDNSEFYRAEGNKPYTFFGSGGAKCYGVWMRGGIVEQGNHLRKIDYSYLDKTVELSQDGFLGQRVLCLKGKWVTRRDVIDYVANTASGVHSGIAKTESDHVLSVLRNAMVYGVVPVPDHPGEMAAIFDFNPDAAANNASEFNYRPNNIDAVLYELLCAAHYFVDSPKVAELELAIIAELSGG